MRFIKLVPVLAVLLLASCARPKCLVYVGANNFGAEKVGLRNTVLSMDLRMYNPNPYRVKLKSTDIDIYIDDHHVGKALVKERYSIPKKDTFSLPMLFRVDLAQVLPNALHLLKNKEIKVKMDGCVKAGKYGIFLRMPVSYERKHKLKS